MKTSLLMLVTLLSLPAQAAGQREQLRVQRQQIEASFAVAMRDCSAKFQITDCELEAKAQRRAALQPVLKQEQALELAERLERSQVQRERVAAKQQAKAQEVREMAAKAAKAASAPAAASSRPVVPEPARPAASAAVASIQDTVATRALAASQAEQARQTTLRRVKEAQAHEKEVLAREAARTHRAAPLPLPASAVPR